MNVMVADAARLAKTGSGFGTSRSSLTPYAPAAPIMPAVHWTAKAAWRRRPSRAVTRRSAPRKGAMIAASLPLGLRNPVAMPAASASAAVSRGRVMTAGG